MLSELPRLTPLTKIYYPYSGSFMYINNHVTEDCFKKNIHIGYNSLYTKLKTLSDPYSACTVTHTTVGYEITLLSCSKTTPCQVTSWVELSNQLATYSPGTLYFNLSGSSIAEPSNGSFISADAYQTITLSNDIVLTTSSDSVVTLGTTQGFGNIQFKTSNNITISGIDMSGFELSMTPLSSLGETDSGCCVGEWPSCRTATETVCTTKAYSTYCEWKTTCPSVSGCCSQIGSAYCQAGFQTKATCDAAAKTYDCNWTIMPNGQCPAPSPAQPTPAPPTPAAPTPAPATPTPAPSLHLNNGKASYAIITAPNIVTSNYRLDEALITTKILSIDNSAYTNPALSACLIGWDTSQAISINNSSRHSVAYCGEQLRNYLCTTYRSTDLDLSSLCPLTSKCSNMIFVPDCSYRSAKCDSLYNDDKNICMTPSNGVSCEISSNKCWGAPT